MEVWFWILGWCLSILTMFGNGFIIFVVSRKRHLRTKTNAFIVSLAVADFCVGLTAVPLLFFCEMAGHCNWMLTYIRGLFVYESAVNLCSLVLDRYIAIVKPLTYLTFMKRRRVIQMVSLSWAIPIAFSSFVMLFRGFYSLNVPVVVNILSWFYIFFELILCGIVIFCFISMLRVVWSHAQSTRGLAKQLQFNHRVSLKTSEKAAVKMMAIVIGLFLICYGIFLRCSLVLLFNDPKICYDVQYKVPILVLNSAVNPLAYAIFKRDIKQEFKRMSHFVLKK